MPYLEIGERRLINEILPIEECAIVNLGDGQQGNEFGPVFSAGIAILGERWKERFYDSNGDCFIDALDLIDLIEMSPGGIMEATRTLEEFSTFWFE